MASENSSVASENEEYFSELESSVELQSSVDSISRPSSTPPEVTQYPGGRNGRFPICEAEQKVIDQMRAQAIRNFEKCRASIAQEEAVRLQKTRIGCNNWAHFWQNIYPRHIVRELLIRVAKTRADIDRLYRRSAEVYGKLIQKAEGSVLSRHGAIATSEALKMFKPAENDLGRVRRKRTRNILRRLRASFGEIPLKISNEQFNDMKRGLFSLCEDGEYHDGDAQAEERERPFQVILSSPECQQFVLSPSYYHDWQDKELNTSLCAYDVWLLFNPHNRPDECTDPDHHGLCTTCRAGCTDCQVRYINHYRHSFTPRIRLEGSQTGPVGLRTVLIDPGTGLVVPQKHYQALQVLDLIQPNPFIHAPSLSSHSGRGNPGGLHAHGASA